MEAASYRTILAKYPQWKAEEWLFLSDNVREVRAALEAGMRAFAVVRPGNPPLAETGNPDGLEVIRSFEEVKVRRSGIQRGGETGGAYTVEA